MKVIFLTIALILSLATNVYFVVVRTTDKTQIVTKLLNQKKWNFSNKQYEFSITDINYYLYDNRFSDLEGIQKTYVVRANMVLKNNSIEPFIIGGEINRCIVLKNNQPTNFYAHYSLRLEKGIAPSETYSIPIEIEISGQDYDQLGNKTYPSTDLKIKSCELILTTNNSQITHKNALTKDPIDADIEPLTITFP